MVTKSTSPGTGEDRVTGASAGTGRASPAARPTLADRSETELLAEILPRMRPAADASGILVPAGDDAAVLATSGSVVATTDSMVRERDWRDDWSTGRDVGAKVVAQNLADVAAMGAVGTGLLVALAADPQTPLAWVLDMADGIAAAAGEAGVPVLGGDLSAAPPGVVLIAVTALGDLGERPAVLRSGARPGDVVAVAGSLGRSGAGLEVLRREGAGEEARWSEATTRAVAFHRAPRPPYEAGPRAARAGASAMIDISDGLVRDAGRVATASGVRLELFGATLREAYAAPLEPVLGVAEAWRQVLGGGEEHSLLACFQREEDVPDDGWRVLGRVLPAGEAGPVVTVDGEEVAPGGWDHFHP